MYSYSLEFCLLLLVGPHPAAWIASASAQELPLRAQDLGQLLPVQDTFMRASYNQGDEFIYVFGGYMSTEATLIHEFELATHSMNTVGRITVTAQGAVVSTGGEDVYYFGGFKGALRNNIWRWNSSAPGPNNDLTNVVATFETGRRENSAVFDPANRVAYMFGGEVDETGPRLDSVVKFDVETHTVETLEETKLPVGRSRTSAIWDERTSVAYIFGGEEAGKVRSNEILRFDPATGDMTPLSTRLPLGMEFSCAVWTGEEAYIIVGNHARSAGVNGQTRASQPMTRFVPDGENGRADTVDVEDLPVNLYGTACAYVKHLNRIYLFGGVGGMNGGGADYLRNVFCIQLDNGSASPSPTDTTTEVPTSTMDVPTSTTEDPTTITTEEPTSTTEEEPTTTEEASTSTTEVPTSTTEGPPSSTPEDPTTTDNPTSTTEGRATTDEEWYTTEDPTSTTEGPGPPSSTTEYPTSTSIPTTEDPTSTLIPTTEDPTSTSIPTTEAPTTLEDHSTAAPSTSTEGTKTEEPTPPLPTSTVDPLNPAVCNATDKYGTRYITTAGNRATAPCPGIYSNGTASWYCTASGDFAGPQPDYSNCTNGWLPDIRSQLPDEGEALNGTFAQRLLNELQQNVDKASQFENSNVTYFGHEIEDIFQVGTDILQATNVTSTSLGEREQLTGTTFGVYSKVLAFRSPWDELGDSEDGSTRSRAATATAFINSSELSTMTLAATASQPRYQKEFTGQEAFHVLAGAETARSGTGAARLSFPVNPNRAKDSYIQVPSSWAANYPPGSLVPFSGLRLEAEHANFLLRPPQTGRESSPLHEVTETDSEGGGGTILNGPLMAFTFDEEGARAHADGRRLNFSEGVRITFRHDVYAWGDVPHKIRRKLHSDAGERPKAVSGSAKCAYWDPTALKWSTTGCAPVTTGRDATVCECNHLTSFALIMNLHQYIGADKALEVITLILTPLSTLGFLAYILLFVYHRKKQRLMSNHPRNELTLGLCIALLVSNLLIMVTLDRGYLYLSEGACTAAGIALHYSLVCAFAWMGLEGVLLARLILVDVFSSGREHVRLERAAAFVVLALIVGATVGLDYGRRNSDGTPNPEPAYGGDAYCWLNGGYLWAFLGPVALVVSFNSVVLVLAVRKSHVLQHSRKASITPPMKRRARAVALWLQGALNLTALMGITWVAGFFMLAENEMVARLAAYAFTLFNASQGIFIFGFHVAANKSIRRKLSVFTTKSTTASHGGGGGVGGGKGAGRENSRSEFNQSSKSHSNGTSGTKLHSSSKYY